MAIPFISGAQIDEYDDWYTKSGRYKGWKYIVVHHSATRSGNAKSFDRFHTRQGYGGLAYHFVIGNGSGSKDGEIEKGWRWKEQVTGTHVSVNSWDKNIFGIGVCLVGNFQKSLPTKKQWDSLVALTAELVRDHKVKIDNIITHRLVRFDDGSRLEQTSCPGDKFPIQNLRKAVRNRLKKKT